MVKTTFSTSFHPRKEGRDSEQTDYYMVNHCSSEGATVAIWSHLLVHVIHFKISYPKQKFSVQFQMITKFIFNSKSNSRFNTMTGTTHLCDLWEHTIVKVFKHDQKSELGLILRQWVIFNKLENFNSLLNYTIDDFTPSGSLCYINENGEILHLAPLKELFNLRWFTQYLMDENEDEAENPLSQQNWMKQTNGIFIKYVIHHKHSINPEHLQQKPFEAIIKKQHEKLDTEEEESNKDEEETTTSSEISEQDSELDTTAEDEEDSETTETFQIHNVSNTTIHDDGNSSEPEDDTSEKIL